MTQLSNETARPATTSGEFGQDSDQRHEAHTVNGSLDALVAAHLDTWNSPDGSDRQQSIAATYTTDVTIGEPGARHTGHAGMNDAISALQTQLPNTAITRTGSIQTAEELVTYPWVLGTAGRPPVAAGRDVLLVVDGAITHLYVLVDAPEAVRTEPVRTEVER